MDISTLYKCFTVCGSVTTDSRNCPEGSMFIALKGESFNGNDFAIASLDKGCQYAVVDDKRFQEESNPRILYVDDCLKALQQLANYHRKKLGTKVIGITGTNGKTTTKELIASVLSQRYDVLYTEGNLNNHIGVPLTLLRLTPDHEVAVIEMGANHPGEIKMLANIAEPDYGLITNVGKAHLEGFGSFEGVVKTKGELYDFLRYSGKHIIFIDRDNENLDKISQGLVRIGYGTKNEAGLYISGKLLSCSPYLSFEWGHEGQTYTVDTHLIGSYNLMNALAAITVGRYFSVSATSIKEALENYIPRNNRSQLTTTESNMLIVDAYNANPTSMMAALENFRLMDVTKKMVILGDMKELGEGSHEEHKKIVDYIDNSHFERVVLVGKEFQAATSSYEHYNDVNELINNLKNDKPIGYYILIKGSNSMKLSSIKDFL